MLVCIIWNMYTFECLMKHGVKLHKLDCDKHVTCVDVSRIVLCCASPT